MRWRENWERNMIAYRGVCRGVRCGQQALRSGLVVGVWKCGEEECEQQPLSGKHKVCRNARPSARHINTATCGSVVTGKCKGRPGNDK